MKIEENGESITLTKVYDAPKELVFSMFQNPYITKWWGPTSWPVEVSEMDFRPGGSWHYNMVGPDGTEAWGLATYEEIDEPNKIVYRDSFSDAEGLIDPTLPQNTTTITFDETDGKTTLTLHGVFDSPEDREKVVKMGMIEGMKDTLLQLENLLMRVQKGE